ncbi:hypothetical protein P8C59_008517 [Phyllachora maydis]|uniref:Tethering factor for nuclear proteasome STS1 n=1 Tax=Phyllachora maydis TaxID=1825666 RepID=A0AAD9IBX3_9PEZI|nr:hypothetical protein P8C59_008517 [Phyllachora maydis]
MNVLLSPQPSFFPHQHEKPRLSPPGSQSPYNMASRKRKADDNNDEMSISPHSSPATASRQLARPMKKARAAHDTLVGRPLTLPRLLETLDTAQLRAVLQTICERHPAIGQEVVSSAPRPTATAALQVLGEYLGKLRAAVPYGQTSSDYAYYRVRQSLAALVETVADFTPQFLPPTEMQTNVSLQYLDGATKIIHELPEWDSLQYRHHKDSAYDDIARAWALVITEASKRGGGFSLHTSGWDQAIAKHHQQSGARLGQAMNVLSSLGWADSSQAGANPEQQNSILDQIMNGSYGSPVRVGPW